MSLNTNLQNLATIIATDIKTINNLVGSLPSLSTTTKSSLVLAINELKTAIDAAPTNSTIDTKVNTAIAALINGAPAALDTLKELADANSTVLTALANRVRVDAAQTFTTQQKNQACDNIGAVKASDVGATDTDFVAIYNAGKA